MRAVMRQRADQPVSMQPQPNTLPAHACLQRALGGVHRVLVAQNVPEAVAAQDDKGVAGARGLERPQLHPQHVWFALHKPGVCWQSGRA
jgi:hypothetical protein